MKRLFTLLLLVGFANYGALAYDANRGFVHPGGLHTQADFDRVKQQLADGNATVTAAYQKLTSAAYAQSSVQTYPVETIVRGGSGENYINAARGAAMAYQNALRWKIGGVEACAKAAVRILMAWCNTTKEVSGSSDQCLAVGLYGYQFAQAAELMRDYEGWSSEDFHKFQQWMLTVWYPKAINFLRSRNGTWENAGKWWQAPGHYWSNWGLCNVMCVISIGILCDDVFIYNQGMSYYKYDQVGTFTDPRTSDPILNDGLTEFLGNLVVTTSDMSNEKLPTEEGEEIEVGGYGLLGQMNESGRDTGHSAMALGLAVDIAKVGWNQGDDLFSYMNHRLAAGIEYVAAQTQSVQGLPWTNYHYGSNGYYYTDSRAWLMTGPALGAQTRPYWGTVIGMYEGVKGVKMPFSERAYQEMGIDEGGQGSTSGGYDHLGYSVLMNTRNDQLCPASEVPTELSPMMEYSSTISTNLIPSLSQEKTRNMVSGKTILHNELGGLVNTYTSNNKTTVPAGQTLRLMPQLPEGEEDTGQWLWNTGATTREITVSTDHSYIYRVAYTNQHGVQSQLRFSIASQGDCLPDVLTPSITIEGETVTDTVARILYGQTAKLSAIPSGGWGTWKWTGSKTTQEITTSALKKISDYAVEYTNQGGAVSKLNFRLDVLAAQPFAFVGTKQVKLMEDDATVVNGKFLAISSSLVVDADSDLKLGLTLPTAVKAANVSWSNGVAGDTLFLTGIQESQTYSARFTLSGEEVEMTFCVLVRPTDAAIIAPGRYLLRHVPTDTYLTAYGKNEFVKFQPRDHAAESQTWQLEANKSGKYALISLASEDSLRLYVTAKTTESTLYSFFFDQAVASDRFALRTGTTSSRKYWGVESDGSVNTSVSTTLSAFPFQLIALDETGVLPIDNGQWIKGTWIDGTYYDLSGRQMVNGKWLNGKLQKGIYIHNGKKKVR